MRKTPIFSQKIGENWRKLAKIGEHWRKLAKIGENCDQNIDPWFFKKIELNWVV
jgi:hypothetical protein